MKLQSHLFVIYLFFLCTNGYSAKVETPDLKLITEGFTVFRSDLKKHNIQFTTQNSFTEIQKIVAKKLGEHWHIQGSSQTKNSPHSVQSIKFKSQLFPTKTIWLGFKKYDIINSLAMCDISIYSTPAAN